MKRLLSLSERIYIYKVYIKLLYASEKISSGESKRMAKE